MTVEVVKPEASQNEQAVRAVAGSQAAELKKFFVTAIPFLIGLLAAILVTDRLIGRHLKRTLQPGGLGPEVQEAVERVSRTSPRLHTVVISDSVGHSLFWPGTEGRPDVAFLTTNQAISVAGNYYLAEEAIAHCPNLHDIYYFVLPGVLNNNLPRELSHDYFCGHFHSAKQVFEVFEVKRDFELSFAHAGRWLLPNLMAANSLSRPAFSLQPNSAQKAAPAEGGIAQEPPDPERLLTLLSTACAPEPSPPATAPPGAYPTILSPVSRYYLAKMRDLCRKHHIHLHVLPSPISRQRLGATYVDQDHIFDGPILDDVPPDHLSDGVHFKTEYVEEERKILIQRYGLHFLEPPEKP